MEQLNLFDFVETDEKKMDAKVDVISEKVSTNAEVEKLVELQEAEETIVVEASSLLDDLKDKLLLTHQKSTQLQVMDKVKIVLIGEEVDSETHNYRKYYEPHLIGKVGEITDVHVSPKGKVTYEVNVYGEKSIFEEAELVWIG